MKLYELTEGDGDSPLILSLPHSGTFVPEDIKSRFTDVGLKLPDTDWHVDRLYQGFAAANNATVIKANYSRYVADMNRPPNDKSLYPGQIKMSICSEETFDGREIYQDGLAPDENEIAQRVQQYWQPYHDEITKQIARIKSKYGHAILYDCHSIRQTVPRLFEGNLPDLNLGTANGKSCSMQIENAALSAAQNSAYSSVLNGRFIGGYITRNYGDPENHVHAFQMEIAQVNYMDEDSFAYDEAKAAQLIPVLENVLHAITDNAATDNT